jgi:aerobic-type carbon monoxide dehydrogenase small subunit (CoxS/CutS family)
MNTVAITTTINHKKFELEVRPNITLLDLLRDELGLMGTKRGCEVGECGACTVLMNGQAVNSCLVLAPQIDGQEILTVEGLATGSTLHPIQESFLDHDAVLYTGHVDECQRTA